MSGPRLNPNSIMPLFEFSPIFENMILRNHSVINPKSIFLSYKINNTINSCEVKNKTKTTHNVRVR